MESLPLWVKIHAVMHYSIYMMYSNTGISLSLSLTNGQDRHKRRLYNNPNSIPDPDPFPKRVPKEEEKEKKKKGAYIQMPKCTMLCFHHLLLSLLLSLMRYFFCSFGNWYRHRSCRCSRRCCWCCRRRPSAVMVDCVPDRLHQTLIGIWVIVIRCG